MTYKVVAYRGEKHDSRMREAIAVVNPATELEKERYKLKFRMNNINLEQVNVLRKSKNERNFTG